MTKKPDDIHDEGMRILEQMSKLDNKLYSKIVKFLQKNTDKGKVALSQNDLAGLEDMLYEEIKNSEYQQQLKNYLALFTQLSLAISQQQAEINQLKVDEINELWDNDKTRIVIQDKVLHDLGTQGMKDVFVKGIAEAVRNTNYYSMDIETAIQTIKTTIVDNGYTNRYLQQTVMDSLSQYDGAMNKRIGEIYEFENFLYIGNTIETSRPFCVHLRDDLGGRFTKEQLKTALNEYCPGGVPSEERITFKTHAGEKTAKKGSGMIEGTKEDNFVQLRGGWGCRHRCIPTR